MSNIDTLSPILALLLQGTGLHNDDWGDQTNANLSIIDAAIGGTAPYTVTGGTLALTLAQARPAILVFSGVLAADQIVTVPNSSNRWTVDNRTSGAYRLTLKTVGGAGIVVPQGFAISAYSDGVNVLSASRDSPLGVCEEYYGIELPDQRYVWANGQLLSRTAYGALFAVLTRATVLTVGAGVTVCPCTEDLTNKNLIFAVVEGPGIPSGTTVTAVASNSVTLSAPTTGASGQQTVRFFPYGNGDGSTTFTVPDRREVVAVGPSKMGGAVPRGLITVATAANGGNLGRVIGEDRHTLVTSEMPSHTHNVTDPGHIHGTTQGAHQHNYTTSNFSNQSTSGAGGNCNNGSAGGTTTAALANITINNATTGVTIDAIGGGTAHNVMQPTTFCNFILRAS